MSDTDKALDIIVRLMDERQELREQLESVSREHVDTLDRLAKVRRDYEAAYRAGLDAGFSRKIPLVDVVRRQARKIEELESAPKGDGSETCRQISKILQELGYGGRGLVEPIRELVRRIKELEELAKQDDGL